MSIVPDAIEPIVGWRYWRVDPGEFHLISIVKRDLWRPTEVQEARCARGVLQPSGWGDPPYSCRQEAPAEGCRCGIYAASDLETLRSLVSSISVNGSGPYVVGEVLLWGKVIPGERGYRAQYAYPKALYVVLDRDRWPNLEEADKEARFVAVGLARAWDLPIGCKERDEVSPQANAVVYKTLAILATKAAVTYEEAARSMARAANATSDQLDAYRKNLESLGQPVDGSTQKAFEKATAKPPPWYQRFDNPFRRRAS